MQLFEALNLAMMAQKARPDLQLAPKSWTATPGYPAVTWRHHCSRAGTPVCSMLAVSWSPHCRLHCMTESRYKMQGRANCSPPHPVIKLHCYLAGYHAESVNVLR